jgi:signal transduction histidine kinase
MSAVSENGLVTRVTRPLEASSADERTAQSYQVRRYGRIGLRWLALTLLAIVTTGIALVLVVRPGMTHAVQIAVYLAISGVVALALGQGVLWLADVVRLGSVRLKLLAPSLLTVAVIGFAVILIARLMFIAPEDEQLLLGFLLFGAAIALMLSWSIAQEMTGAIRRLGIGARRIASGEYCYRLPERDPSGAEELSQLAVLFNQMAGSVETAFAEREAAEAERRHVIAALSHDLRTPLASIRAMIEALDDGVVTDAETMRRYQRSIRIGASHLGALMDDLFDLARLESGAFHLTRERMPIDDLLSDALESVQSEANLRGVQVTGSIDGPLPLVSVDTRQMHRVLTNLLHNALQHTATGDAILLRATHAQVSGANGVRVEVVDTGSGISREDLPHIFERSYRGESSRSRFAAERGSNEGGTGAGLGLTIARGIVEAHGGAIEAASPVEGDERTFAGAGRTAPETFRGTLVTLDLPASNNG